MDQAYQTQTWVGLTNCSRGSSDLCHLGMSILDPTCEPNLKTTWKLTTWLTIFFSGWVDISNLINKWVGSGSIHTCNSTCPGFNPRPGLSILLTSTRASVDSSNPNHNQVKFGLSPYIIPTAFNPPELTHLPKVMFDVVCILGHSHTNKSKNSHFFYVSNLGVRCNQPH